MTTELLLPADSHRRPARWAATREEFWALPESTLPAEYLNGEIIMAPAPTVAHQLASRKLFRALDGHAQRTGTGELLYAPLDVVLPSGDVVQPDIFLISPDELAQSASAKRIHGVPLFVVEIISPGSTKQDLIIKRDLYREHGVREYWAVDLGRKRISQFVLFEGRYALTELAANDTVRAVVLGGFAMSVADLLGIA